MFTLIITTLAVLVIAGIVLKAVDSVTVDTTSSTRATR